ncbi:MAG: flagellar motor switch protein FliM [Candidatus Sumerlaeota bacterium]|nr:flagellar motor switch protein FliM [Candidatus Sumerlaeota bacterium]
MAQVLSQDEVDALLHGISGGDIPTGTDKPVAKQDLTFLDLMNQDRIVRGRMPALEMLHDRFCRAFRSQISTMLRRPVDLRVLSNENIKYGEFMRSIPVPTSMHAFKMEPLKGFSLLVIEGKLVFALIDNFFGGKGAMRYKLDGRDFTPIEQRIIRKVVGIILETYENAWKPLYEVKVEWSRTETNPQFANICLATDDVIAVQAELDLEDSQGRLSFIIPYSSIEPIKEKLKAGYQSEGSLIDSHWHSRFREQLQDCMVNCHVELGHTHMTGRDLLRLGVGDVISLQDDTSTPVKIFIEGELKFEGFLGCYHSNYAIQIYRLINHLKGGAHSGRNT